MEIFKVYKTTQKAIWEVSNYGNVKKNGKPYECTINPVSGYKVFGSNYYLHKSVAELFIPNPDNKPQVDHIDTDRLNNHIDNLRWCTRQENCNNILTLRHYSEANTGKNTGGKNGGAIKCIYNNIEFGCIKDAYDYAVKNCGYDKTYDTFKNQLKKQTVITI